MSYEPILWTGFARPACDTDQILKARSCSRPNSNSSSTCRTASALGLEVPSTLIARADGLSTDARRAAIECVRAANKCLRRSRYQGPPRNFNPRHSLGFFPSCAHRNTGRVLTAGAIHCACDSGNACDTLRRRSRKPIEKAWADRLARSDWTPLRPLARLKKVGLEPILEPQPHQYHSPILLPCNRDTDDRDCGGYCRHRRPCDGRQHLRNRLVKG